MATATATLSKNFKGLATYSQSSVDCVYSSTAQYDYHFDPDRITVPKWISGRKQFSNYTIGDKYFIDSYGFVSNTFERFTQAKNAAEKWGKPTAPAALVQIASNTYSSEIVYDGGVWYSDWENRINLDSEHPIPIPQKGLYRFVGAYDTNGTTGTKYINADGTPTAAFLALAPTYDFTIYAQFEKVSYKITLKHSSGSPTSTVFYYKIDGGGFYADDLCTTPISSITPPERQLYRWNGAFSSSSQTEANRYINSDGTFTAKLTGLTLTGDKTIDYANYWTQVSYKITVDPRSGSADVLAYYTEKTNGGIFADWLCETQGLQSLPIPRRSGYRFLGYFSSSSGGTKYAEYDGVIQSALKTRKATTTIYAQWRQADSTVTLDANGGTGGGLLYFDSNAAAFFDATSAMVSSVPVPTYTGNTFLGYYDAQTGGNQIISASGVISPSFRPSDAVTLYAQWTIGKSIVEIYAGEGTAAAERFYYDHTTSKFYADADLTEEITSVALPTLRLFNTNGLFTESSGGTSVVSASGVIQPSFVPTDEFVTVYAQYTRRCFEVMIDSDGGSFSVSAIYHAPSSGGSWFSDDALNTPITNVGIPVQTGYTYGGCFYGGNQVIGTDGTILPAALLDEDYTASVQWTAKTYTLTFNAYPGTPSFSSKTVTFNAPIGAFPTVTIAGRRLDGWTIDGSPIEPTTVWTFDAGKTANANWHDGFGGCTDFFQLETANGPLMLVASNSGATRTVIETSHTGALAIQSWDSSVGAFKTFGMLMNPVCTYRIRKEGRVTINLGAAWAGSGTKSGFMLVNAEYATAADGEPVLVVRGAANEGARAINRWSVNLDVNPDHIAQDPMNAVNGGGELTECKTLITCDPVVPMENGMPCASDIVHGKVIVKATTNAYGGENAPTARSPFIETNGVQPDETDVDFPSYAFQAERSL